MTEPVTYECTNARCALGTPGNPGRFTGGITAEQLHVLTGRPLEQIDDAEHGDGVCPNCGQKGRRAK